MTSKRKGNRPTPPFVQLLVVMLESEAYRTLPLSARLVLDRLEIEHSRRHGAGNGDLRVSYNAFLAHMGRNKRHIVAAALKLLEERGFIEVVEPGACIPGKGWSTSRYRVTYLPTVDAQPTHEWQGWCPQRALDSDLIGHHDSALFRKSPMPTEGTSDQKGTGT